MPLPFHESWVLQIQHSDNQAWTVEPYTYLTRVEQHRTARGKTAIDWFETIIDDTLRENSANSQKRTVRQIDLSSHIQIPQLTHIQLDHATSGPNAKSKENEHPLRISGLKGKPGFSPRKQV